MEAKKRQDLKALLKILRSEGVLRFKMEGLELELHPDAMKVAEAHSGEDIAAAPKDGQWSDFPTGTLTPEQLAFYSAGGSPDEDPFRKDNT
jgi:hypothetical protein